MRALLLLVILLQAAPLRAQRVDVDERLRAVRAELVGITVPPAAQFATADRLVRAGDVRDGPIAAIGDIRVDGTVSGDVLTLDGSIIVGDGGRITGSAIAIGGEIRAPMGSILGERRVVGGALVPTAPPSALGVVGHRAAVTVGWGAIVLLIGLGVLFFGGQTLQRIGTTLDTQFGRSFTVGALTLIAAVPALLLACLGLALTVIGILLIPFVIVAAVFTGAGVLVLAFLASARMTGHAVLRSDSGGDRSAAVRALVVGVLGFMGLWLTVALLSAVPIAGVIARLLAIGSTGAALAAGVGATVLSRGGKWLTSAAAVPPSPREAPVLGASSAWQTPTPVAGVAAVRRPTANSGRGS
jgi:hypothetical protein